MKTKDFKVDESIRSFCKSKKKTYESIRMASFGKLSGQQNEKVKMKSADNQNLQKQINWISCKFYPSNSSRLSLYQISFLDTKGSLATALSSQLLAVWWTPLVSEDTPADLRSVKKFTRPDFWAKIFTH